MVTENKTMKIRTEYTATARKEINRQFLMNAIGIIAVGGIDLAVVIAITIAVYTLNRPIISFSSALTIAIIGVVAVFIGLIFLRMYIKEIRKPLPHTIYDYEFFDCGITAKETKDGEVRSVEYYYNIDICKTIESKHYIFLYINAAMALVIDKATLYPAELDTIHAVYFHRQGGHVLELAPFKPGVPTFAPSLEQTEE